MIPFDGCGYGKATHFIYMAKSFAKEEKEACSHWVDLDKVENASYWDRIDYINNCFDPVIQFVPQSDSFPKGKLVIKCVSCDQTRDDICSRVFQKTEKRLTEYFSKF